MFRGKAQEGIIGCVFYFNLFIYLQNEKLKNMKAYYKYLLSQNPQNISFSIHCIFNVKLGQKKHRFFAAIRTTNTIFFFRIQRQRHKNFLGLFCELWFYKIS